MNKSDELEIVDPKKCIKSIKFFNQTKTIQGFTFHKFRLKFSDNSSWVYYYLEEHDFKDMKK